MRLAAHSGAQHSKPAAERNAASRSRPPPAIAVSFSGGLFHGVRDPFRKQRSGADEPDQRGKARERQQPGGGRDDQGEAAKLGDGGYHQTEDHHPPREPPGEACRHGDARKQKAERHDVAGTAGCEGKPVEDARSTGRRRYAGLRENPLAESGEREKERRRQAAEQGDEHSRYAESEELQPAHGRGGVDAQRYGRAELQERADGHCLRVLREIGAGVALGSEGGGKVLAARERGSEDQARQEEGGERDGEREEGGAAMLDFGSTHESFIL